MDTRSQRPETMRSPHSDSSDLARPTLSPDRVRKEDVMINLSVSPEPPAPPRTRSPLARSHLRSRSLVGIPGMPSMTRAYSSPGLDSRGRYIFVNGRGVAASPVDVAKRTLPLQMRADDHIETRMGAQVTFFSTGLIANIDASDIPSHRSPALHFPLHFQQPMGSPPSAHTSPILGGKYNESYPGQSASSTSSVPSTPTSLRSRSPSISSLETIPDIPDAEAEAVEEDDRIAQLKAAADAADAASNNNRRRGAPDAPSLSSSFSTVRGGRKRWSVCGAERRQDLDLETIWED
ncbi:hypothetical protein N7493_004771 [Penicillium malachiteum]|uniref:Uncharacterized protein n=1 Tax=Penicillium malachiteum TaxID=1324776 RepID=A0AAD6MXC8_9EURO|nr:hypothetical protein N7493_004771 [Penicillium malachiteum]